MRNDDYYNCTFDLQLAWDNNRVSVQYQSEPISGRLYVPPVFKLHDDIPIEDIIKFGKHIATLLLPGRIRGIFKKKYRANKKVRLRLIYPEGEKQLMEIPWEYAYLPLDALRDPHKNLLGLNQDISIVHQLTNKGSACARVNAPIVKMKYLSWLKKDDKADEQKIFEKFKNELHKLETIIECEEDKKGSTFLPATFAKIKDALENDHVLHLTCHGGSNALYIKGATLNSNELTPSSIRAVILFSCNSAAGHSDSTGVQLHLKGVPVVVGFTYMIQPGDAAEFAAGFYQALANQPGDGLEKAVVAGRNTLFQSKRDCRYAGFGLPRLFLNSPDSILIPEERLFGTDHDMLDSFDELIREKGSCTNLHPDTKKWQNELDAWVRQTPDAPKRNWFLMTGPAGSGKSTQVAKLIKKLETQNDSKTPPLIYHFCQAEASSTNDPLAFVRYSLVRQLIKHYGEAYKQRLPEGRFPLLVGNVKHAIREFFVQPLRELADEDVEAFEPPVIIIDGVDLVGPNYDVLDMLLDHRGDLDDVARFLITADTDDDIPEEVRENILWLTNHHQDGKPDLPIAKQDDPLILFSKMKERLTLQGSSTFNMPPLPDKIKNWSELYNLFDSVVKAIQKKHGKLATRLLDLVTVSYEPLSVEDVAILASFDDRLKPEQIKEELSDVRQDIQPFFKPYKDYKNKLILYHGRLKIYRLRKMNPWNNNSVALTHELFVKAFQPQAGDWTGMADWWDLTKTPWQQLTTPNPDQAKAMSRYVRRYLANHAYYSYSATVWRSSKKRPERAETFLSLICDPQFRKARYDEVGWKTSLQDLWNGLRVIYTEHIHNLSSEGYNKPTRIAFDRLMAANEPGTDCHGELIELEKKLRRGEKEVGSLWEFLDIPPKL